MQAALAWIIGLAAAYLLGGIPFGLLLARLKGVDIRTVGSGNIGATNVFRAVSKPLGLLTFALDAVKGFVPAFVFPILGRPWLGPLQPPEAGVLLGTAAIAGHTFPVFLRGRGGKGVATSAGVLLGVAPSVLGVGLAAWIPLFLATRYVSVASIGAAFVAAAFACWRFGPQSPGLAGVFIVLSTLIIWLHRTNIERLRKGTEHRFEFRRAARSGGPEA